jgi:hypothetical protein
MDEGKAREADSRKGSGLADLPAIHGKHESDEDFTYRRDANALRPLPEFLHGDIKAPGELFLAATFDGGLPHRSHVQIVQAHPSVEQARGVQIPRNVVVKGLRRVPCLKNGHHLVEKSGRGHITPGQPGKDGGLRDAKPVRE